MQLKNYNKCDRRMEKCVEATASEPERERKTGRGTEEMKSCWVKGRGRISTKSAGSSNNNNKLRTHVRAKEKNPRAAEAEAEAARQTPIMTGCRSSSSSDVAAQHRIHVPFRAFKYRAASELRVIVRCDAVA